MIQDALRDSRISSVLYARSYTGTEAPRAASTSRASKARKYRSSNRSPSRAALARCMASKPRRACRLAISPTRKATRLETEIRTNPAPLAIEIRDGLPMSLIVQVSDPHFAGKDGPGLSICYRGSRQPLDPFDSLEHRLVSFLFHV